MISLRYILIEILEIIMVNNLVGLIGVFLGSVGIVLYDPLGLLFEGTGLVVIGLGLICMFFGYKKLNAFKLVNRAVEALEKNRSK
tara:strand:+ start:293 stop:547 length:255 start_codon:yes stop_codon:yes gene_type:complete